MDVFGQAEEPAEIQCSRCGERRAPDHFNWRNKRAGKRDRYCRSCRAAYKKEHYAANRQRYLDQSAARRKVVGDERRAWFLAYLADHPCVDCGETDARVLEFDHRGEKSFGIATAIQGHNWDRVLAEVEKCDVRCVNCHREKTARELGFNRARLWDIWRSADDSESSD